MDDSTTERNPAESDSILAHLIQLDHWTFLVALCLVTANVFVESRYVSAVAATLLSVALVYDAVEFYSDQ